MVSCRMSLRSTSSLSKADTDQGPAIGNEQGPVMVPGPNVFIFLKSQLADSYHPSYY